MQLIFLYGLPATGKLTVARELAAKTGFKLFHNHLTVDLLLSVFDFGSPAFVALREQIWLNVFTEAARNQLPGMIFTFNPESTVRPGFVPQVLETLTREDSTVEFIELNCPIAELKTRLDSPSRREHQKLTSVELFEQLHQQGSFDGSHMPKPRLTLDTSRFTPAQAAATILHQLELSSIRHLDPLSV